MNFMDDLNIGMSIAPGRKKGTYNRDLNTDLHQIRNSYRIDTIFTLLQDSDLSNLEITNIRECAEQNGNYSPLVF